MKNREQKTENKTADLSPKISIITLNVNELITWLKDRNWQSEFKKHELIICFLKEILFTYNDLSRLKVNIQKKTYKSNKGQRSCTNTR